MPINPATIYQTKTEYPADSVETCPNHLNVIAVGTYLLSHTPTGEKQDSSNEPATPQRSGQLYLYSYDQNKHTLNTHEQIDMPAILDMKWGSWTSCSTKTLLGVANSSGQVQLWQLSQTDSKTSLSKNSTIQASDPSVLCLSLDWSNRGPNTGSDSGQLIVSLSNGELALIESKHEDGPAVVSKWTAHASEVWCATWDLWNPKMVWSGSDDCQFSGWDTRQIGVRSMTNTRSHEAGVCSIASNPFRQWMVATGSYDDQVRVWDTRIMKSPVSTCKLAGGAWRVRFHPTKQNNLIVAGMHAGFYALHLDDAQNASITHHYTAHESLAYGVDFCAPKLDHVISCSFYDHQVRVWAL